MFLPQWLQWWTVCYQTVCWVLSQICPWTPGSSGHSIPWLRLLSAPGRSNSDRKWHELIHLAASLYRTLPVNRNWWCPPHCRNRSVALALPGDRHCHPRNITRLARFQVFSKHRVECDAVYCVRHHNFRTIRHILSQGSNVWNLLVSYRLKVCQ